MMENRNTFKQLNIGSAGMRGVVGPGLNPASAGSFAAALGCLQPGGRFLVGTDTRTSSDMLKFAVISALAATGAKIVDGGVLTAGMMHFLIPHMEFDGGILITGGHQQPGDNALIPLSETGAYFEPLRQRELFDHYHAGHFEFVSSDWVQKVETLPDGALAAYWQYLTTLVDVEAIRHGNFAVIADFCNGAGALYGKEFAKHFNLNLTAINDTPSGVVPRDPEPQPRSGSLLRSIIRPLKGDIGLVFNSDLSRLSLVSEVGEPLSEEFTFPLALRHLLSKKAGKQYVITNLCSSKMIDDICREHGVDLHYARVGQAQVIDELFHYEAAAAGEGSGSFTTGALAGFDGFYMTAVLLEALAATKQPLSVLRNAMPQYHMVKQTIVCNSPHAYLRLKSMRDEFGDEVKVTDLDGLRFDWDDGFLSLRLAATEPILRVISESKTEETAEERAWRVRLLWERANV